MLEFLMEKPGRVFSRAQLLDGVWGMDSAKSTSARLTCMWAGCARPSTGRARKTPSGPSGAQAIPSTKRSRGGPDAAARARACLGCAARPRAMRWRLKLDFTSSKNRPATLTCVTQTSFTRPVRRQSALPNRPSGGSSSGGCRGCAWRTIALRVPSTRIVVRRNTQATFSMVEGRGTSRGSCWFVIAYRPATRLAYEVHAEDIERHAAASRGLKRHGETRRGPAGAHRRRSSGWSATRGPARVPDSHPSAGAGPRGLDRMRRYRCLLPRRPGIRRQHFSDYRDGDGH